MMKLKTAGAAVIALALASTVHAQVLIQAWDFFGQPGTQGTQAAGSSSADLDSSNILSRGATAAGSAGANSFRTVGFRNEGISVANTDYFEFSLSATAGHTMSLSNIVVRTQGTASFFAAPGVSQQFGFSIDGGAFTLIGAPVVVTAGGTQSTFDLSGTAALQNLTPANVVTLRYYASGQTTTGGWGFFSSAAADAGLAINGTGVAAAAPLAVPEPATYMLLGFGALMCAQQFRRRRS